MLEKGTNGLEGQRNGAYLDYDALGALAASGNDPEITAPGTVACEPSAEWSDEVAGDGGLAIIENRHHTSDDGQHETGGSDMAAIGEAESDAEAGRSGGDVPPTDIPSQGSGEAGDDRRPSLEAGLQYYYDPEEGELLEGRDDSAYYDLENPETAYVSAGSFAVGRADPGDMMMGFEGSSDGCRIVTLSNQFGEGALVHVDVADMGTQAGEEAIGMIWDKAPSLAGPDVTAFVVGDVEMSPLGAAAGDWNARLADYLRASGVTNVRVISQGSGKDVILRVADGAVTVKDSTGHTIYPPATQ